MNGRIYDPTLGRFLQADPHIQAPMNSQNYNRYSYVLNNPMSYTDPSGYFFKWLGKKIKKYWKPIVAIAAAAFTYGAALGAMATTSSITLANGVMLSSTYISTASYIAAGALSGAVAGAISTGSLRGTLNGALSGAAFAGIGQAFSAGSGFYQTGGLGHVGTHAFAGGILEELNGGNFGHGFFSAGFTKGVGGRINSYFNQRVLSGTLTNMVIGGTAAVISGGKFKNGATTAAFQTLFNHYQDVIKEEVKNWKNAVVDLFKANPESTQGQMAIKRAARAVAVDVADTSVSVVSKAGEYAGYCPLVPCQAVSWGAAGLDLMYNDRVGGVWGNVFAETAGYYMDTRFKYVPSPLKDWGQAQVQGALSEYTSGKINGD